MAPDGLGIDVMRGGLWCRIEHTAFWFGLAAAAAAFDFPAFRWYSVLAGAC
jgi:hypothetical protein